MSPGHLKVVRTRTLPGPSRGRTTGLTADPAFYLPGLVLLTRTAGSRPGLRELPLARAGRPWTPPLPPPQSPPPGQEEEVPGEGRVT